MKVIKLIYFYLFFSNNILATTRCVKNTNFILATSHSSPLHDFSDSSSFLQQYSRHDGRISKGDRLQLVFKQIEKLKTSNKKNKKFIKTHKKIVTNLISSNGADIEIKIALYRRTLDLHHSEENIHLNDIYNRLKDEFYLPKKFINKVTEINHLKRMNSVAKSLALHLHSHGKYGNRPYAYHLYLARDSLRTHGANLDEVTKLKVGILLWLHDSIEDTDFTLADAFYLFGKEMGEALDAISNIPKDFKYTYSKEPAMIKRARYQKTKKKTKNNRLARLGKIFDRITNTEQSKMNFILERKNCFFKYSYEWDQFVEYLYKAGEADAAWSHLFDMTNNNPYGIAYLRSKGLL